MLVTMAMLYGALRLMMPLAPDMRRTARAWTALALVDHLVGIGQFLAAAECPNSRPSDHLTGSP
jgi:hypothetical protein